MLTNLPNDDTLDRSTIHTVLGGTMNEKDFDLPTYHPSDEDWAEYFRWLDAQEVVYVRIALEIQMYEDVQEDAPF